VMNLLSQIMSEEANEGAGLGRVARFSNQLLKYLRRNYYRNSSTQQPPRGGIKFVVIGI